VVGEAAEVAQVPAPTPTPTPTPTPAPASAAAAAPALVSVVLPCRNAERHLAGQLEALARQECPVSWELVVSDNGCTDGSLALVEQYRARLPRLVVLDSSARRGPAAARNAGVRAASGSLVVFCDADDEVAPGWLAAMAAALGEHGLVAARLEHERLNEPWTVPVRNPQAGLLDTDPPFLPYSFCAALGVRRAVHEALGGFDETFLDGGEDRDYCYRAQLSGVPLALVPDAVVHYRHRRGALAMYRQARGYAYGQVRLYRAYRTAGLGRPPLPRAVGSWLLTPFKLVPALRNRRSFALWMARLGWRVGRLKASVRHRVWAL
jgi:glycosyltransferase involved in cell wall biosynthesis